MAWVSENPFLWFKSSDGTIKGSPMLPDKDAVLTKEVVRDMYEALHRDEVAAQKALIDAVVAEDEAHARVLEAQDDEPYWTQWQEAQDNAYRAVADYRKAYPTDELEAVVRRQRAASRRHD